MRTCNKKIILIGGEVLRFLPIMWLLSLLRTKALSKVSISNILLEEMHLLEGDSTTGEGN